MGSRTAKPGDDLPYNDHAQRGQPQNLPGDRKAMNRAGLSSAMNHCACIIDVGSGDVKLYVCFAAKRPVAGQQAGDAFSTGAGCETLDRADDRAYPSGMMQTLENAGNRTEMRLSELAQALGGTLEGEGDPLIRGLAGLDEATADQVSFLANSKYVSKVDATQAAAVLVGPTYEVTGSTRLIRCADPYFAYREAMVLFYGFRKHPVEGMSERAEIHSSAKLGSGVAVGAFAVISPDVEIGENTVIYPGVFLGPNVRIGADCVLYPNVVIYDDCVLGDRVTVHAGSSIGQDGFGYSTHKFEDGVVRHTKIPPIGNVILEDDVEVGSCCAIERATMGPTVIGAGTKFADLVAIGHGTKLGQHCLMVSQSGIAGSTMVGNYCVFGGQAGVVGHIRIGDGVRVGAQAGVVGDVSPGQELLGSPAIERSEAGRVVMATTRLPQIRQDVKRMTKQLADLEKRLADLENQA